MESHHEYCLEMVLSDEIHPTLNVPCFVFKTTNENIHFSSLSLNIKVLNKREVSFA